MKTKVCSKCGVEKPIDEFYKDKHRKDGVRADCKSCVCKRQKKYGDNHKEERKEYNKEYNETHKEELKLYRETNKEEISEYAKEYNITHRVEKAKNYNKYYNNNKAKIREYEKIRRQTNILCRSSKSLRCLVAAAFRNMGFEKNSRTHKILGELYDICTDYLILTGFANYDDFTIEDFLAGKYHIDHIIPLSTAKTIEDVIRLNHISNLQLLTAADNLSKSDKLDWKKG